MRWWGWLGLAALSASALALGLPGATDHGGSPEPLAAAGAATWVVAGAAAETRSRVTADPARVLHAVASKVTSVGLVRELERQRTAMAAATLYLIAGDPERRLAR